nr:hypothetical protein [Candidatus Sigynarchaeota archaeon]
MVANNTITRLERVFTREALTDLLWTRDFFAGCFHQFRWSGLSGVTLKPEELNVLGFVSISEHVDLNDPSQVQVSVYGFAIVGVRKSSEASSSLFFIPVVLESRDPGIQLPSPPSETEAAFQFANGPIIVLRIATKDFSFWKRIGKTIIEQAMPKKEFLLDMLDPG